MEWTLHKYRFLIEETLGAFYSGHRVVIIDVEVKFLSSLETSLGESKDSVMLLTESEFAGEKAPMQQTDFPSIMPVNALTTCS